MMGKHTCLIVLSEAFAQPVFMTKRMSNAIWKIHLTPYLSTTTAIPRPTLHRHAQVT